MLNIRLILFALAAAAALLTGCTKRYVDLNADQPWIGPNERAKGMVRVRHGPLHYSVSYRWYDGVQLLFIDSDLRLSIGSQISKLDPELKRRMIESVYDTYERAHTYAVQKKLICLRPPVVVLVPGPWKAPSQFGPLNDAFREFKRNGTALSIEHLEWGYTFGTQFPDKPGIVWFQSGSGHPPQPIPWNETSTEATIDVWWGKLLFRREGEMITVDAVGPNGM